MVFVHKAKKRMQFSTFPLKAICFFTIKRLHHSEVTNRSIFSVKNSNNTLADGWNDNSTTRG
uniref:Uncharacterized protein n=1 Tax=Onchocerca volvulus TaxID=6282 RepID=A0A8R1Y900_ONCVO